MTKIMGILNLTPDSFSDGGKYNSGDLVISRVEEMIKEGASIIDIGAESTRPNPQEDRISAETELSRLLPYLKSIIEICRKKQVQVSLDTRNSYTAKKCLDLGIDIINDVSGVNDSEMIDLLRNNNISVIIMHNLGIPPVTNKFIISDNPTMTIYDWLSRKIESLNKFGISHDRIIVDPGIGFGTSPLQSFHVLKNIEQFKKLGCKILAGYSRKSMFRICTSLPAQDRDIETFAISAMMAFQQIDYIRVHNVSGNQRVINTIKNLREA